MAGATKGRLGPNQLGPSLPELVEVPGIEPGSNGNDQGLLRAQPRWRVLGLPASSGSTGNTAQFLLVVPHTPGTGMIGKPSR